MVSASQSNASLIRQGDNIVRVNVGHQKAHNASAADVRSEQPNLILEPGKLLICVGTQCLVMFGNLRPPDFI